MTSRWVTFGAATAVIAAVAVVGSVDRPAAAPGPRPQPSVVRVLQTSVVCPSVVGTPAAPASLAVASLGRLAGQAPVTLTERALARPVRRTRIAAAAAVIRSSTSSARPAYVITASGAGAGGLAADEIRLIPRGLGRSLNDARCLRPGTDWWLTGADGRVGYVDYLTLDNPGATPAQATVTAWSAKGTLRPPRLQAVSVPPFSALTVKVADEVPDAATVTLHVHANTGRLAAQVLDRRIVGVHAGGGDWIGPTRPPARAAVVVGWPGGSGTFQLLVTNPGRQDATVGLRLVTATGSFAPAGHPTVLVRAGRTATVDLSSSVSGTVAAVTLASNQPVVTAAMIQPAARPPLLSDLGWLPAAVPLTAPGGWADNRPPFGTALRVQLCAPAAAATVRLTAAGHSKVVQVPAGRTVSVAPLSGLTVAATGPLLLTPLSGGPVYASRSLYALGAHGPLLSTEPITLFPQAQTLPPVTPDPRAGLRPGQSPGSP
jgi:hypothetical protein